MKTRILIIEALVRDDEDALGLLRAVRAEVFAHYYMTGRPQAARRVPESIGWEDDPASKTTP